MKKFLFILGCLFLGIVSLFALTNDFKRTIKILDCEGTYYDAVIEFSDQSETISEMGRHNAKVDVANCLCEKYLSNKNKQYKEEIIKIYTELSDISVLEKDKKNADSICKDRDAIFFKMYYY